MQNPYNQIDPQDFLLRTFAQTPKGTIYLVELANEKPFDACVFRDHLARFILDEFEGEAHLGNDDSLIRNLGNNLALLVEERADVSRLKANFRVF